jgi:hypothetical protein
MGKLKRKEYEFNLAVYTEDNRFNEDELNDMLFDWLSEHNIMGCGGIKEIKNYIKEMENNNFEALINWVYYNAEGIRVTVKAVVADWCVVTDANSDMPYLAELEFVQNMYKNSIDNLT